MYLLLLLFLKILNYTDYSQITCSMTNENPKVIF